RARPHRWRAGRGHRGGDAGDADTRDVARTDRSGTADDVAALADRLRRDRHRVDGAGDRAHLGGSERERPVREVAVDEEVDVARAVEDAHLVAGAGETGNRAADRVRGRIRAIDADRDVAAAHHAAAVAHYAGLRGGRRLRLDRHVVRAARGHRRGELVGTGVGADADQVDTVVEQPDHVGVAHAGQVD